jgi:uncharacterized membrane protein
MRKSNGEKQHNPRVTSVVRRNAEALERVRRAKELRRPSSVKISDAITKFTGSMGFVVLHVVWFAIWIVANLGAFGIAPFDPFPFGLLTMIVSLEAIFLSTFVLVSQNRMSVDADARSELDLHINVLAEHEVTHLLTLLEAIAKKVGVTREDPELAELEKEVRIGDLLRLIEQHGQKPALKKPAGP